MIRFHVIIAGVELEWPSLRRHGNCPTLGCQCTTAHAQASANSCFWHDVRPIVMVCSVSTTDNLGRSSLNRLHISTSWECSLSTLPFFQSDCCLSGLPLLGGGVCIEPRGSYRCLGDCDCCWLSSFLFCCWRGLLAWLSSFTAAGANDARHQDSIDSSPPGGLIAAVSRVAPLLARGSEPESEEV